MILVLPIFFVYLVNRHHYYFGFNMAKDNSNKYSKENYNLLNGMKRYLRIEHKADDKDLLDYLRKQAGLHRE